MSEQTGQIRSMPPWSVLKKPRSRRIMSAQCASAPFVDYVIHWAVTRGCWCSSSLADHSHYCTLLHIHHHHHHHPRSKLSWRNVFEPVLEWNRKATYHCLFDFVVDGHDTCTRRTVKRETKMRREINPHGKDWVLFVFVWLFWFKCFLGRIKTAGYRRLHKYNIRSEGSPVNRKAFIRVK